MKYIFTFLILVLTCITVSAHDVEVDGIYYNLDNERKTAEVTYKGSECSEFENEYSGTVVIPASITVSEAEYSVTSIGEASLWGCSGLTSVTIPNTVTSIARANFWYCNNLTSINVETGNQNYCSVDGVLFNKDVTTLIQFPAGHSAKNYNIPNSVKAINTEAFKGCSGLANVSIPNSVEFIGGGAFEDCTGLTSVTIPYSVTYIELYAFEGCDNLTSINVDADNNSFCSIDGVLFFKPATSILCFPKKKSEKNYIIPNSVTRIGYSAFEGCTGLTSVTIPNSVTRIESFAFFGCGNLKTVTCAATSVPSIGTNAFTGVNVNNATLIVPEEAIQAYRTTAPWSEFGTIVSIEADATATAEANKFKTDNADILGKTTETVTSSDLEAINKALNDYSKLSEAAKDKLTNGEKDLLDSLKNKADELKAAEEADAAATAEANKFKTDNADILGKTTETVTSSDLEAINKALNDYSKLSEAAKDKLTNGEKDLLDSLKNKADELKAAEEADAAATAEANKFKTDNADILGKTTGTVKSSDIDAINKALDDYSKLSEAAKDKLTNGEKDLLDSLKNKAEELKATEEADAAATAEANKFKTDNADILGKTTETVKSSDIDAINKALDDYSKLSEAAKDKLTNGEKELLDSLKEKVESLVIYIGDVNEDSKVDIVDVAILISYLKDPKSTPLSKSAADVDQNNIIDKNDVYNLSDIILQKQRENDR